MVAPHDPLAERRRILRLETLYDLAITLHSHQPEQELVDGLLQKVCAVLDPAAAVAVTRDAYGAPRALAYVGWEDGAPESEKLLAESIWSEMLTGGRGVVRSSGALAGRPFQDLAASPFTCRGVFLGYIALLDKEMRGGVSEGFSEEDRRFLQSVASLGGVALDGVRQVESLEEQRERLEEENRALRGELTSEVGGRRIIAQAPAMRRALEMVSRVAPRGVSVVVRGESGTGKELVAKLIHLQSERKGALVAVNCSAIPETLLESELFGIERGVATGVQARRGKFELADGGTLFLDEIGDMSPSLQVRLLRALQEMEIVRVGGHQPIPVDTRLVAATHRDLELMVEEGEFREDLYYRLKGVEVTLPPLRDRREEIPHLIRYFAEGFSQEENIPLPIFPPETLALLMHHDFPGNVRELQNLVQAAISLADGVVEPKLMESLLGGGSRESAPEALDLSTVERRHIARILHLTSGNKSRAAKILGLDRRTLQRKGF